MIPGRRRVSLLLLPSLLSGVFTFGIAVVLFGYNLWQYIANHQLLYEYLFSVHGIKTYLWHNALQASVWGKVLLGTTSAYYVMLFGSALTVGVLVFALLESLALLIRSGREYHRESALMSTRSRRQYAASMFGRLGLRTFSIVAWVFYSAIFATTILPFAVGLTRQGTFYIQAHRMAGYAVCIAALVVASISLHLHVVFLRLAFLRPRLFYGALEAGEVEAFHNHKA